MNTNTASFASIHAAAVREVLQVELGQAINKIEEATHVVIGRREAVIYAYGDKPLCEDFAVGIERDVRVVQFSRDLKESQISHKIRDYRGLRYRR